jgi:hypothetical protein
VIGDAALVVAAFLLWNHTGHHLSFAGIFAGARHGFSYDQGTLIAA